MGTPVSSASAGFSVGNFRSGSQIRLRTKDRATLVVPRQEFSSAKRRKIIFFFPGRVSLSKTVKRAPRPLNSIEKKSAAHPVLTLAPLFTRKFQSFRHHRLQEAFSRDTLKSRRKKNSGLHCTPHLVRNRCGSPIAQKKKNRASEQGWKMRISYRIHICVVIRNQIDSK